MNKKFPWACFYPLQLGLMNIHGNGTGFLVVGSSGEGVLCGIILLTNAQTLFLFSLCLIDDFLTERNFLHRLMENTHDLTFNGLEKKVWSYSKANCVIKTGQWHRE